MDIISRASWGARPPRSAFYYPPAKPTETYLHHSVGYGTGGASYMRAMQAQHQGNGWKDIAYNFVIDPATLTVYEGRGWGAAPGAQKGHNVGTWAVCIMGDFRSRTVTSGLLETIAALIRFGHEIGEIPLTLTGGHRDAPNQATTCPGSNLHREIPEIRNLLEAEEMKIRRPSWFGTEVLDRLAKDNIRPRSTETEDMWRTLAFLDRASRGILGRAVDWARAHVKTSIAAALAVGAGAGQIDYGELVREIGRALAG